MTTVLMIAEKPSVAQTIASVFSRGNMKSTKTGICPVHEFTGTFKGKTVNFRVSSVVGHVYSTNFYGNYQNWEAVDPAELFSAPFRKVEADPKGGICRHLQRISKGCGALVLWLDCDREGENICFEVIDNTVSNMLPHPQVYRARFSSITPPDLYGAMSNLGVPNKNEALSVDARQEIDLRVGVAFTRFQTLFFRDKYGDLDSNLISFGPCQTPTLGFCVARHDEIQSFTPEKYWYISPILECGYPIRLEWRRGIMFDKDVASLFYNKIKDAKYAKMISYSETDSKKHKPIPLNTVELLKVASKQLHIGPQQTMVIAERLYTRGFISYPRTESTVYPANYDLIDVVRQHTRHPDWGTYVSSLLATGIHTPRKGIDAGDHPPITPMSLATEDQLGYDEWKIYDYIARHFIASVSHNCTMTKCKAIFKIGDEEFKSSGLRMKTPGFTEVMPWMQPKDDYIPNFGAISKEVPVKEISLSDGQTSPPDYLTESELIGLMEHHGIGTDASIPVHINNICSRNFCQVDQTSRKITPTRLGISLVHGYYRIDPELVLPTVRANIEQNISLIAKGHADYKTVVAHAIGQFFAKYKFFTEKIGFMDELFGATFSKISQTDGKPFTRCGKCNRFLTLIETKPVRLYCSSCQEAFSLPQNGNIVEYSGAVCPLDNFGLITFSTGSKSTGRMFSLCPCCYNSPSLPDMEDNWGCNRCPHTGCPHALENRKVMRCPECDTGYLVLEPCTAPGKYRISCNMCPCVVSLPKSFKKVTRSKKVCDFCGSSMLTVDFASLDQCPLKEKKLSDTICISCEEEIATHCFQAQAVMRGTGKGYRGGRGGRGRGRGGSRGGRGGRGRGGRRGGSY